LKAIEVPTLGPSDPKGITINGGWGVKDVAELGEIKKGTEVGYKWPNKYIWHACEVCGKERWVVLRHGKPEYSKCIGCGTKIRSQNRHGQNSPAWKGGQCMDRGYVLIFKPEHPEAMANGYVKRARLVLEKKLGRPILLGMRSHHRNEIKDDDRPENLEEWAHSEHARYHGQRASAAQLRRPHSKTTGRFLARSAK